MPVIRKIANDTVTTVARLRRNTASVSEFLTATKTPDQMAYQLILDLPMMDFPAFKTFLNKGVNVNYCHEDTGNTLLHFLYYYGKCSVQFLELLLEKGAKTSLNKKSQSPITLAEKNCNATELQKIKDAFESYNAQFKPNKTRLISYPQQESAITIGMPLTAFFGGVLAGSLEEVAQRHKEKYPFLPNLIFFGLQPIALATINAIMDSLLIGSAVSVGIEEEWLSFVFYLGVNYWSLLFAQGLEIFSEKIQNKIVNRLIPILVYIIYFNPNMLFNLLSETFVGKGFQAMWMPLLSTLCSGALFKASKYATHKVSKSIFFKDNPLSRNNTIQPEIDPLSNLNPENMNLLETHNGLELRTFRAN